MRTLLLILVLLASAGSVAGRQAARQTNVPAPAAPRLLVILMADQFRSDYADTYGHHWTKGLRRLFSNGAVFPLAAYPYSYTVTCPGHASISTGAPPAVHGIVGNDWFDRARGRSMSCTDDASAVSVGLAGVPTTERHSVRLLQAPTLSDEVRRVRGDLTRVAAVSLKPRSTIMLAGRPSPGTVAIWEEDNGTWATSTAYGAPPPSVDAYVKANPVTAAYGSTWDRLLPLAAFLYADDAPEEPAPRTFPFALTSTSGQPDMSFVTRWERSPMSDAYLAELAVRLIDDLKLGQRDATDVLAVSFSALDLVGHRFGPRSHEVQDVLARLDVAVGKVLDALDRAVGAGRYVVGFSADHGVAPLPEQAVALGLPAGRLSSTTIRRAVETAVVSVLGPGTYVAGISGPNIYLQPDVVARIAAIDGGARRVEDAVLGIPGIANVYWAGALAAATPTADAGLAAARLSYVAGRSGDLVYVPLPYWMAQATGTTHGTPYTYDQRVPVVFFGAGVRPGRYFVAASPLDLAPTLASLAGVTMPQARGRALRDGLR